MSIHQSSFIAKAFTLISPVADWLSTWRLQILFLFLLLQVVSFCTQGIWVEDFWEHSAAVTAFIENPFHPGHPQLSLQAPHPFLNPYTFVVAQFARLFHLDAISALSIFGTLNFCLFCYGLHAFIASLQLNNTNGTDTTSATSSTDLNNNKITFYALLFVLFLWGGKPWPYSGFFNYQIYLLNLPYPSTFVGSMSLLGLAINARYQHTQRWAYLLALIAITTLALLAHPLTAQFLLIGLAAQIFAPRATANKPQYISHLGYIKNLFLPFLKLAIITLTSFAFATLWPFYPILELFQGASKAYDTSNGDMYFHLVTRLWLFVMLAPLFIWILFKPPLRPLLIIFIATASIYVFGYFTGRHSFGRIVSYTVIVIQIACAVAAFRFETWAQKVAPGTTRVGQLVIALVLISCTSPWLSGSAKRLLTVSNSLWLGRTVSNQVAYKDYLFLPSKLKVGSIVFANLESSWLIPSFGARVIAVNHPVAFVNDLETRQQDIGTFFDSKTSLHVRTELLKKYGAQYLLLNKKLDADWVKIDQQFSNVENESQRVETETFLLIKLSS